MILWHSLLECEPDEELADDKLSWQLNPQQIQQLNHVSHLTYVKPMLA